jgi:hypothetical protein
MSGSRLLTHHSLTHNSLESSFGFDFAGSSFMKSAPETWLRPNRRVLWLSCVVAALMVTGGLGLAWFFPPGSERAWAGWLGLILAGTGLLGAATFAYNMRLPRLGFDGEHLLVYLRSSVPDRVPIDSVECFFWGQGPSLIRLPSGNEAEAANIIVRLAERAAEWRDRETNASLGEWKCGYITIRGNWCERITPELVKQLNERLTAAHRQKRQEAKKPAPKTAS